MTNQEVDQDWGHLVHQEQAAREAAMVERYQSLAGLDEDERRRRLKSMAAAEYSLSEGDLRSFTLSRMRTWLQLDFETAQVISSSYDAIMQEMPATVAMRRVSLVQTLAREFSAEDEERLRALAPRVFAGAPGRAPNLDRAEPEAHTATPGRKRPIWAFWKRG